MYLTAAALAYITLARHGVSVTELQELLSLEDKVLADSYQCVTRPRSSRMLDTLCTGCDVTATSET